MNKCISCKKSVCYKKKTNVKKKNKSYISKTKYHYQFCYRLKLSKFSQTFYHLSTEAYKLCFFLTKIFTPDQIQQWLFTNMLQTCQQQLLVGFKLKNEVIFSQKEQSLLQCEFVVTVLFWALKYELHSLQLLFHSVGMNHGQYLTRFLCDP